MKKILHMTPPEINNGVHRYILNHLPYMDRKLYKFGFLTRAADGLYTTPEYKLYPFAVHKLGSTQRDDPEALRAQVKSVLSEYDAIHLHTSSWRGFLIEQIAMEMGMEKVIVHSHSTGIDIPDPAERERQIAEHYSFREKFSKDYATDFCACSKEAAEWLFGEAVPSDQIRIMPNAIDTGRYKYNPEVREKVRKRLGIENKFVIGHVGRYSYTKNQQFLIKLLRELRTISSAFFLVCIGEGGLKEYYMSMVKECGLENSVILMDWVEDVEDYLQAFDLFALPSVFEGFPISVMEAQTAGLPCLISDNVTEKVDVTGLVECCACDMALWKHRIAELHAGQGNDRSNYDLAVKKAGFDIADSVEKWKRLYQ